MTRSSCFVKGCNNGYLRRRKENVRLGVKQKCMFRSPKCAELRKKWCLALGVEEDQLKPHNVICEDHFDKKYIIKYDVTLLRDGTTFLLERERCRLHPEAVPSIDPIASTTTKTFCPSRVSNSVAKGEDQTSTESPIECSNVTIDSPTECANVTVQFLKVTRPIECRVEDRSTQAEKQQKYVHGVKTPTACKVEKDIAAGVKNTEHGSDKVVTTTECKVEESQAKSLLGKNHQVTSSKERKVQQCSKGTQVDIPQKSSRLFMRPTEGAAVGSLTQVPAEIRTLYSFPKLLVDVNQCQRLGSWGSVVNKDSVDFLYWDASRFQTTMVLRVSKDLGMKLYAADKHLIKKIMLWPSSFNDIIQTLRSMEKMTLCEGTGLKGRRPTKCLGEVDISTIETRRGIWKRCQPCCEARKTELIRQREVKRGLQNRLKLTNRKNCRLKMKVNKLKEDVERAKKKCAGIQERVLHEKIEALPQPVQESVRTCLAAAKVKPRGRRYTLNWIYECLLIRMKSRSMYEHLRTHFILPLPCIDTLDRYIKKLKETHDLEGDTSESLEKKLAAMMGIENRRSIGIEVMELSDAPDLCDEEVPETAEKEETETNEELVELEHTQL